MNEVAGAVVQQSSKLELAPGQGIMVERESNGHRLLLVAEKLSVVIDSESQHGDRRLSSLDIETILNVLSKVYVPQH